MKLFSTLSAAILVSILMSGCTLLGSKDSSDASIANSNLTGIDVSKYQGKIDFEKVKAAGIRYVFVRATEGITYQDTFFKQNLEEAREAGLVIGAYHFYETDDDPISQLKNFTSMVSLQAGDLPPVVDIEKLHDNDQLDLTKNIQIYLDGLERHYKAKPIIYSGKNFANKYITTFSAYPLWLAEYQSLYPTLPQGWDKWTFWQYSQTGKVDGVVGDVDVNRYNGEESSFNKILIKSL
ncbi:MAG: GH25 family lysozyme [Bermanella sp.]